VTQLIYDDEFIIGELLVIILFNRQHKPDSTSPVLIIGAGPSGLSIGQLVTNNGIVDIIFEASCGPFSYRDGAAT
jgi:ribulose 1,5-bisphosphate synthetase/thiazole synthase